MGNLVWLPKKKGESMMSIQKRTSHIPTAMNECHKY